MKIEDLQVEKTAVSGLVRVCVNAIKHLHATEQIGNKNTF